MMSPGTFAMLGTVIAPPLHANVASSSIPVDADDASKKIRKPYTITKSRESWTEQEHDKFLEALQLFDRDWKKIEAFVGSKSVIQIRSHAQKYFLKVQKNGSGEHVPPPRPKRKSALPYPQKASKSAPVTQQASGGIAPLVSQAEPAYNFRGQSCTLFVPPVSPPALSAWVHHTVPSANVAFMAKGTPATDFGVMSLMPEKDCSGSNGEGSSAHQPPQVLSIGQENREACLRATPDFAEVYGFIGSVFDPSVSGHLKKMKEMAPIDRETVLLLMKNLSINLSSPDFEEHKLFLSVYDMGSIDSRAAARGSAENQNVGDDISVSCQPGLTQESESTDADSHSEHQQQTSLLQSYAQGTPAIPRQSCLPYDGGGGSVGAITNMSKVLSGVNSSPQLQTKPCINLQHSSLRMRQIENKPAGNVVHRLGVQGGSY